MKIQMLKTTTVEKPKLKAFLVTYRIDGQQTPKGTREQRYDALIALLENLPPVDRREHFEDDAHLSTSSWLVRAPDANAHALGRRLARVLTKGVDLLEVMHVAAETRFELTD